MAIHKVKVFLKRLVLLSAVTFLACFVIVVIRTLQIKSPATLSPCLKKDSDYIGNDRGLIKRLAESIQFKTISWEKHTYNTTELDHFRNYIIKTFPLVHSTKFISFEVVNGFSLLYKVTGKNAQLKPYMLAAHMDVVPVDESQWSVPPFEGRIENETLYGRGTLDNKCNLMGILEALEFMLEKNIQPERSFYIAFGHDEEAQGLDGAAQIAKILKQRGVELLYLLDEGTFVIRKLIMGVSAPVGLVGVTEKGYLTVKVTVEAKPGHSSIPPTEQAIFVLSQALTKLGVNSQPNMFGKGPEIEMLTQAAPYASFPYNLIFANLWLFSPLVSWVFSMKAISNANIRSTTAVTMIGGGIKENVLPNKAWAIINHRVHPNQRNMEVVELDRSLINDDRVKVEVLSTDEAHPISPHDENSFGYQIIKKTATQFVPDVAILPICMVANTDTRWYLNLTNSIYRFSIFDMDASQTGIIHGHNEKISTETYERVVNYYYHIIRNSDMESLPQQELKTDL